jgi:hypothetical protein
MVLFKQSLQLTQQKKVLLLEEKVVMLKKQGYLQEDISKLQM